MIIRNNGYHGSSSGRARWTEPNFEPVECEERVNCFLRKKSLKKENDWNVNKIDHSTVATWAGKDGGQGTLSWTKSPKSSGKQEINKAARESFWRASRERENIFWRVIRRIAAAATTQNRQTQIHNKIRVCATEFEREGQKNEKELRKHTAHTILFETITHIDTHESATARDDDDKEEEKIKTVLKNEQRQRRRHHHHR